MSDQRKETFDFWFQKVGWMLLIGTLGWIGRQYHVDNKDNAKAIAAQSAINESQTSTLKTLTEFNIQQNRHYEKQETRLDDHEKRIMRREATSFTGQDISKLTSAIARLDARSEGRDKAFAEIKSDLRELTKLVREKR